MYTIVMKKRTELVIITISSDLVNVGMVSDEGVVTPTLNTTLLSTGITGV